MTYLSWWVRQASSRSILGCDTLHTQITQPRFPYLIHHIGHFHLVLDIFTINFISPSKPTHPLQYPLLCNFHFLNMRDPDKPILLLIQRNIVGLTILCRTYLQVLTVPSCHTNLEVEPLFCSFHANTMCDK